MRIIIGLLVLILLFLIGCDDGVMSFENIYVKEMRECNKCRYSCSDIYNGIERKLEYCEMTVTNFTETNCYDIYDSDLEDWRNTSDYKSYLDCYEHKCRYHVC